MKYSTQSWIRDAVAFEKRVTEKLVVADYAPGTRVGAIHAVLGKLSYKLTPRTIVKPFVIEQAVSKVLVWHDASPPHAQANNLAKLVSDRSSEFLLRTECVRDNVLITRKPPIQDCLKARPHMYLPALLAVPKISFAS